jgi:hypothetical protein
MESRPEHHPFRKDLMKTVDTDRRSRRTRYMIAITFATLTALWAQSASAAVTHNYTGVSFGPDGVNGSESFVALGGVAEEPESGDIYAYDRGSRTIYKFASSGDPAVFSSTGTNAITGVGFGAEPDGGPFTQIAVAPTGAPAGTAGDIYVATGQASGDTQPKTGIQVYAADGTKLGEFEGAPGRAYRGVATDPAGNVYGVFAVEGRIDKFTPTTNPPTAEDLSETDIFVPPSGEITDVAVDGFDNTYVGATAGNAGAGTFKLGILSDPKPVQIDPDGWTMAIDPSSNELYADSGGQVVQYSPAGIRIGTFGAGELSNSSSLAVAPGGAEVLVASSTKLKVFGPAIQVPGATTDAASAIVKNGATLNGTVNAEGGPQATCVFQITTVDQYATEHFEGASSLPCSPAGPFTGSAAADVHTEAAGLARESEYVFRLVASSENGKNYGAPLAFATPGAVNVKTASATGVGDDAGTLNATINPEGAAVGKCFFEWGITTAYGNVAPCEESEAEIGSGSGEVQVHALVGGLVGGSTYHFRIAGENAFGSSTGSDETLMTLGPTIVSEGVGDVRLSSAELVATVNPNGTATSYYFEYETQAQFESNPSSARFLNAATIPPTPSDIGAGSGNVPVTEHLSGLAASTGYYFRVVGISGNGTTFGPPKSFKTLAASALGLPDGRVYEQVTPVDKNGSNIQGASDNIEASPSGDGITSYVLGGIPGGEGSQEFPHYLSLRGADAWTTQGLLPPARLGPHGKTLGISEDLNTAYTVAGTPGRGFGLFEKDTSTNEIASIYDGDNGEVSLPAEFVGSTSGGSVALFEVDGPLLGGVVSEGVPAPGPAPNLYLWDRATRQLRLVGLLNPVTKLSPLTAPAGGAIAGSYNYFNAQEAHFYDQEHEVLSPDAARVYFTSGTTRQLYVRLNPLQGQSAIEHNQCVEAAKACTLVVSESRRSAPDPVGAQPAKFLTAADGGTKVLFMSNSELTNESNTGGADDSPDLYEYDTSTRTLTDLTPSDPVVNPRGAAVGGVLGVSKDGSYIYFAAGGILGDGSSRGATEGDCPETAGKNGACNIYVWHEGVTSFIAHLSAGLTEPNGLIGNYAPAGDHQGPETAHSSRLSADGRVLLFSSTDDLQGYEAAGHVEFYRYEFGSGQSPTCVTCNPTGAPARSDSTLSSVNSGAISLILQAYNTRNLSEDGERVFFESDERLVAADTNDVKDVYEWEAPGTPGGTCTTVEADGGCIYLISSGTSPEPSYFGDADVQGDNAFFFTAQSLVAQDTDSLRDIYDARVGGGLPGQNETAGAGCAQATACRGALTTELGQASPGTSTFLGPGNKSAKTTAKPCTKTHVRRHGRCMRKKLKKERKTGKKGRKNGPKKGKKRADHRRHPSKRSDAR